MPRKAFSRIPYVVESTVLPTVGKIPVTVLDNWTFYCQLLMIKDKHLVFFKTNLFKNFICLKEEKKRGSETETKRKKSCILWIFLQLPTTQPGWARLMPGARNPGSSMWWQDRSTGAITCSLPGFALAGSWNGKWNQDSHCGTLILITGVPIG